MMKWLNEIISTPHCIPKCSLKYCKRKATTSLRFCYENLTISFLSICKFKVVIFLILVLCISFPTWSVSHVSSLLLHFTSHFLAMTRKWLWRLELTDSLGESPFEISKKRGKEIERSRNVLHLHFTDTTGKEENTPPHTKYRFPLFLI